VSLLFPCRVASDNYGLGVTRHRLSRDEAGGIMSVQEDIVLEIAVQRNNGMTEAVAFSIRAVDEFFEQGEILFLQFGKAGLAGLKCRNRMGLDVAIVLAD
jgi:hypothetical protein